MPQLQQQVQKLPAHNGRNRDTVVKCNGNKKNGNVYHRFKIRETSLIKVMDHNVIQMDNGHDMTITNDGDRIWHF